MLAIIIILTLACFTLPLALALAPMLVRSGESWPESSPDHTIARPYRETTADVTRLPRVIRAWKRPDSIAEIVVLYQAPDYDSDSLGFDFTDCSIAA